MSQPGALQTDAALDQYRQEAERVVHCPLCLGAREKVLLRHSMQSLRKCLDCGVRFTFPQPSPAQLETHFANGTPGFAAPEASFERNRQPVLSRVAGYIRGRKSEGHILDVGCATGFFLSRFFADSAWRRSAVELSHQSAQVAAARNIEVFTGTLPQAKFSNHQFDVVTALDTFYYFLRPQSELAEMWRVLRSDGLLVLELPLAVGRIWRTSDRLGRLLNMRRRPLLETSDHLFYYDRKAVSLLLASCGFRVEEILPLPANRQPRLWRDVMYRSFSLLSSGLNLLSGSRVFLGPRFLVIAAKENSHRAIDRPLQKNYLAGCGKVFLGRQTLLRRRKPH
jgi:SAM-dependent methyltransferase